MSDDNIPVLTDLIEERIDITAPDLGFDVDRDMYIDDEDDADLLPLLDIEPGDASVPELAQKPNVADNITDSVLEQTIRRILDEHMELAWQEIRLAIQISREEDDL